MIDYSKFKLENLKLEYQKHPSYGLINIPNFLPHDITQQCADEFDSKR